MPTVEAANAAPAVRRPHPKVRRSRSWKHQPASHLAANSSALFTSTHRFDRRRARAEPSLRRMTKRRCDNKALPASCTMRGDEAPATRNTWSPGSPARRSCAGSSVSAPVVRRTRVNSSSASCRLAIAPSRPGVARRGCAPPRSRLGRSTRTRCWRRSRLRLRTGHRWTNGRRSRARRTRSAPKFEVIADHQRSGLAGARPMHQPGIVTDGVLSQRAEVGHRIFAEPWHDGTGLAHLAARLGKVQAVDQRVHQDLVGDVVADRSDREARTGRRALPAVGRCGAPRAAPRGCGSAPRRVDRVRSGGARSAPPSRRAGR